MELIGRYLKYIGSCSSIKGEIYLIESLGGLGILRLSDNVYCGWYYKNWETNFELLPKDFIPKSKEIQYEIY